MRINTGCRAKGGSWLFCRLCSEAFDKRNFSVLRLQPSSASSLSRPAPYPLPSSSRKVREEGRGWR